MTAAEALNQGYEFKELRFQHGYVSRKLTLEDAEVIEGKAAEKANSISCGQTSKAPVTATAYTWKSPNCKARKVDKTPWA